MEVIKADNNTEFDVLYSDGTKNHVQEGLLLECKDNTIFLHMGTNRANVIFAAIESLFEFVIMLGLDDKLEEYLDSALGKDGEENGS